ncbi:DUF1028 domain-containing protein [Flagellimonas sp. CMM7]|uniref:DUF1028 domain-containing protein n=1 Tax=Flagellimonas sp. CMM7 TaxID=2654676 RepID=UPI0013CFACE2|nr:DUF1028 domain-containing protein [Flagellimonas sp. CMM7]UII81070.1 DUF1028 domain-containing protein [Flagellimonas sp. CMM7]
MKLPITALTLFFVSLISFSQNLPSLLKGKNINSTFSILAYDEHTQEWGIAVATNNIYVGNSTIYIEPGLGAFSVIAETEPSYAQAGFEKLREGKSIMDAIQYTKNKDDQANYRQVSGIDKDGNVYAFTGKSLKYWNGNASQILGKNYVVMGNQLEDSVLTSMSRSFETANGTLAQRLMESLVSGQRSGGQISGKQSAALVVKGTNNDWFNQIDLRVDHSSSPVDDLKKLMDFHYGRIRLNQALYAHREGNQSRALKKLSESEKMLDGWTGMYSRIASANILLDNKENAVKWVKKGISENPNWSVYLPAFYFLKDSPEMKGLINPSRFTTKDWEAALNMLSNLGRELEVIELTHRLKSDKIESSYLNFLLGRSCFYEKDNEKAIKFLELALQMDKENIEAEMLLNKINS